VGLSGDGLRRYWMQRALDRAGYEVLSPEACPAPRVVVLPDAWELHDGVGVQTHADVASLLVALRSRQG